MERAEMIAHMEAIKDSVLEDVKRIELEYEDTSEARSRTIIELCTVIRHLLDALEILHEEVFGSEQGRAGTRGSA